VTPTVMYSLGWPVALRDRRLEPGKLLRSHLPFVAFAFSRSLGNCMSRPGQELAAWGPAAGPGHALRLGARLALRTMLLGLSPVPFVLTAAGARLMTSMHQHLRPSGRFAYAVLAGYRLLEQLPQPWATSRAAQAVRDPWRRGRGPWA